MIMNTITWLQWQKWTSNHLHHHIITLRAPVGANQNMITWWWQSECNVQNVIILPFLDAMASPNIYLLDLIGRLGSVFVFASIELVRLRKMMMISNHIVIDDEKHLAPFTMAEWSGVRRSKSSQFGSPPTSTVSILRVSWLFPSDGLQIGHHSWGKIILQSCNGKDPQRQRYE